MNIPLTSAPPTPPALFVSYSWANDEHIAWVVNLARRIRANGVDVHLDRWNVRAGHDLNLYMERYAEPSARVLVVLSDDYGPKADGRAERPTGVGTETAIVSPTVYRELGNNRVVPIVPNSGTVTGQPVTPKYLDGRNWIDFRGNYEAAHEQLLRELHGVPIEVIPPLGANPFVGTTYAQARSAIHNHPARWHAGQIRNSIRVNLNENSGHFKIGTGEASLQLACDCPWTHAPGPKEVRHLNDYIEKLVS